MTHVCNFQFQPSCAPTFSCPALPFSLFPTCVHAAHASDKLAAGYTSVCLDDSFGLYCDILDRRLMAGSASTGQWQVDRFFSSFLHHLHSLGLLAQVILEKVSFT